MKLTRLCPEPLPESADLPIDVFVGPGAAKSLPEAVDAHLGESFVCVADPDTWAAANRVFDLCAAFGRRLQLHLLPPNPKGSVEQVESLAGAVGAADGLLAVGSGTINDLVKSLAVKFDKPCVVLGTAASMNGYASSIAALMDGDLKVTVPAVPPRAIVLDNDILRSAPAAMTQAGIADLLSKPVSTADWWIASRLGESVYDPLPGLIVEHAIHRAVTRASGLPQGDSDALQALAEAIVLSGVSMAVEGNSAPASGGEHLISHLWDMERVQRKQPLNLHGAQVGLTVCMSTALYHHLLAIETPSFPEPPDWAEEAERIRRDHNSLAESVLSQAKTKYDSCLKRQEQLKTLWPEIREHLLSMQIPKPARIHEILRSAGAPDTLAALNISRYEALHALRCARDIRSRFTVLDLAFELGHFPAGVERTLDDSGV